MKKPLHPSFALVWLPIALALRLLGDFLLVFGFGNSISSNTLLCFTAVRSILLWGLPSLLVSRGVSGIGHRSAAAVCPFLLLAGIGMQLLCSLVTPYWSRFAGITFSDSTADPSAVWLRILCEVLIPSLCEEAFFRGVLQISLENALSSRKAVCALSVILFAFSHGSLMYLPAHLLIGFLLVYCMDRYGDWKLCFLLHCVFNGTALLIEFLPFFQSLRTVFCGCGLAGIALCILYFFSPRRKKPALPASTNGTAVFCLVCSFILCVLGYC